MPQMSPFNWTIMFVIFIGTLLMTMNKMFINNPHIKLITKLNSHKSKYSNISWLW